MYGIDPGPVTQSIVFFDFHRCLAFDATRDTVSHAISDISDQFPIACEWIESFGMAVGKDVFRTVHAIGYLHAQYPAMRLIPRRDIKLHLCRSVRAKDSNIRQALIDRFGHPGTKKNPGVLYGIKSHYWSALAVAVTALECERTPNEWSWSESDLAHG